MDNRTMSLDDCCSSFLFCRCLKQLCAEQTCSLSACKPTNCTVDAENFENVCDGPIGALDPPIAKAGDNETDNSTEGGDVTVKTLKKTTLYYIIGGVVGAVLLIIIICCCCCGKKKKKSKSKSKSSKK